MELAAAHHVIEERGGARHQLIVVGQDTRFQRMIDGEHIEIADAPHAQHGVSHGREPRPRAGNPWYAAPV